VKRQVDLPHILLLIVTGIAGGAISSLVGGAAVVTYPALLAIGLPPVTATVGNLVALSPGNLLAALYDRGQLPPFDRSFLGLVVASLIGALAGALVLLWTPERIFAVLVPLLLGFATLLFAFAGRISAFLRARAGDQDKSPHRWSHSIAVILPVSFYGGYFGAGVGVLLIGVLSIGRPGDYRAANVTKNLVTSLNSLVAAAVFIWQGAVPWTPSLIMMAGALAGALVGARLAQIAPHAVMRVAVIAVGALLTVVFAWRYWF
jgi:uncharacterized membrane protein YfcA